MNCRKHFEITKSVTTNLGVGGDRMTTVAVVNVCEVNRISVDVPALTASVVVLVKNQ